MVWISMRTFTAACPSSIIDGQVPANAVRSRQFEDSGKFLQLRRYMILIAHGRLCTAFQKRVNRPQPFLSREPFSAELGGTRCRFKVLFAQQRAQLLCGDTEEAH